jgi:hypothetical protein
LWGDSFAPPNPADRKLEVPLDAEPFPNQSEPLGGLLALLGALFNDQVKAVYIHAGLASYQSVLDSQSLYLPHDVVVPGALTAGDLCDVAAVLAPRPLRLEGLVDGLNRKLTVEGLGRTYERTRATYRDQKAAVRLTFTADRASDSAVAGWLVAKLN